MQPKQRIAGMTLIELMVAMGIGAFLMIGAITVFMQSRTTFRVTESVSRLQENGRFALDALEPDIRMAHYFGLTTFSDKIGNRGGLAAPAGPGPATCGNNWTIDFDNAIAGSNNRYPPTWACAGFPVVEANADTLVVRRVSEDPVVPSTQILNLQSARSQPSEIFVANVIPAIFVPATSQTFQVMVNGYYVSRNSTLDRPGNPVPSLRSKTLQRSPGGPVIQDNEILAGVEDMQIQFGVDTDLLGTVNRGSIDRYVNPEDPILDPLNAAFIPSAEILAVRLWLRIRAERPENGFTDTTNYVYADRNVTPNDGFRRVLVTKTIYLRNARPPE